MPPMKKQASPTPTPRAAALSQSASRFSAGATSAWQNIAGNSPRLAAAGPRQPGAARVAAPLSPPPGTSRVALEPQRLAEQVAPAAAPETIRQVGWREQEQAVSMSTKRKYSVFGVGFGPKVPVFETDKVKLPVYQETDRNKRYYAVVKAEDIKQIKREGLKSALKNSGANTITQTVEQYNSQGHTYFFGSESSARSQGHKSIEGDYAIIAFCMPEYHTFIPGLSGGSDNNKTMRTAQDIPSECIRETKIVCVTSKS